MDKYTELIKDIATLIADTNRENFLLKCELRDTKQQLADAESKIAGARAFVEKYEQECKEDQAHA